MRAAHIAVVLLTVAADPAIATNLNFLEGAPLTYFTKTDQALFKNTTLTALNDAKDGETRSWSNAQSRSSGEVTVLRTLPGETKCRELQITNHAAGRSHTEHSVFCFDTKKNRWAMRPNVTNK